MHALALRFCVHDSQTKINSREHISGMPHSKLHSLDFSSLSLSSFNPNPLLRHYSTRLTYQNNFPRQFIKMTYLTLLGLNFKKWNGVQNGRSLMLAYTRTRLVSSPLSSPIVITHSLLKVIHKPNNRPRALISASHLVLDPVTNPLLTQKVHSQSERLKRSPRMPKQTITKMTASY